MSELIFNLQWFGNKYGTNADDFIENNESGISILAYAGNDTVLNTGQKVTIDAGDGDNYIHNAATNSTVKTSSGNDLIYDNDNSNVVIDVGGGDDIVHLDNTNQIFVDAGEGNNGVWSNNGNFLTVKSGTGDDSIYADSGENISVDAGEGNNYIHNDSANSTVKTGGGNDEINDNDNSNVVIDAGDGDDIVHLDNTNQIFVDVGEGNNEVWSNNGNFLTVKSGTGDDSIYADSGENVSVNAGEGNNYIHNVATNSTVKTGSGNDEISDENNSNVFIDVDSGDDKVYFNNVNQMTVDAGEGDDEIGLLNVTNVSVNTGEGNNNLWNENGNNVTIKGGSGNDAINTFNGGSNVSVDAGEGDNIVWNSATNATLKAGSGNDEMYNEADNSNVLISSGAGNDSIGYRGENITIEMGAGDDYIQGAPNKAIVYGGTGKDTMYVWYTGKKVTMYGGADDDYLWNEGNNGSINGGKGNDSIQNLADNVTIEGGDGNDSIISRIGSFYVGDNALINGGAGNDTIRNGGSNSSVNGGTGNDLIENWGFNSTIEGGAGDDTIYNSEAGFIYVYKPNSGNDIISGFSILETLVIEGAEFTTMKSGQDVIVNVGENTITLKNAANLNPLNIVSSLDEVKPLNVVNNYDSNKIINGSDGSNWIRNYAEFVTIKSDNKTDDIYSDGNNVVILGNGGADKIRNVGTEVSINGGAGNDIITEFGANTTVTTGTGNDTVAISGQAQNLTITDLQANDVLDFEIKPRFARFKNNVLEVGNTKINLPNVSNINNYRNMTVTWNGSTKMKLGTLLDEVACVWTIKEVDGVTVAEYGFENGTPELVIKGLKRGLTSEDAAAGINISNQQVTLSENVLGNDTVEFGEGYSNFSFAISNDARADFTFTGWTFDSKNSTYKYRYKALSDGYKVCDKGKKVSRLSKDEFYNAAVVKGLKTNLQINSDGTIDGIYVENVVDEFRRIFFDDKSLFAGNSVTGEGEDCDLIFRDDGDYTGKTLSGSNSNDAIYIEGSGALIRSEGGDDFIGVYHSGNSIDGGAGNDEIYITNDSVTAGGGVGNDSIENYGLNVSINGGEGIDYIYNSGDIGYSYRAALIEMRNVQREDAKNKLENFLEEFNADSDLQSIVEHGENSPVLADMDSDTAKIFADFIKATKDFAESSLAYKTDLESLATEDVTLESSTNACVVGDAENFEFLEMLETKVSAKTAEISVNISESSSTSNTKGTSGTGQNMTNFLYEKVLPFVENVSQVLGAGEIGGISGEKSYGKVLEKAKDFSEYYDSYGNLMVGKSKIEKLNNQINIKNQYPSIIEKFEGLSKVSKKIGGIGNWIAVSLNIFHFGTAYAAYSEEVEFYEKMQHCIIEKMTPDNAEKSKAMLKVIDEHIRQAEKNIGVKGIGTFVDVLGIIISGVSGAVAGAAAGAVVGAAGGTVAGPVGTLVGLIAGIGVGFIVSGITSAAKSYAQQKYVQNVTPSRYPTWNEVTGKKSKSGRTMARVAEGFSMLEASTNKALVTLNGGKDGDAILNDGEKVLIIAGEGADAVVNRGSIVTIEGNNGEDYIENTGDDISINGGAGNDSVVNAGNNVTIESGAGDNYISNEGDYVTIKTTDGDNIIENYVGENILIVAGAGNDSINNALGKNITIDAGDGENIVGNYDGENVSIKTGKDDDLIENYSSFTTINSGAGDDVIQIDGDSNSLNSGAGDDLIFLYNGSKNKIDAGAGNDVIFIEGGTQNLIRYTAGDDIIFGYEDKSNVIEISNEITNTMVSGEDLVIKVGNNNLTLAEVAGKVVTLKLSDGSNSTINVESQPVWSIDGTTATYGTSDNDLIIITGLKSNAPISGISLNDNVITLSNSVLNQGKVSVSNGYTLKLADDVPKFSIINANWSVSGTTATYKANANSAGYSISSDGKTINYTNANGGNTLVTVSGLKSNAPVNGISLNGNVVTLSNSVLNQGTVSVSNGYTLKLADDVAKSSITNATWSISGTTATYKASATSTGYALSSDAKTINYTNASGGNTLVTVSGLKNGLVAKNGIVEGITIENNIVKVSSKIADGEVKITGNGYTLEIIEEVPIPEEFSIKNNILTVSNKFTGNEINLNEKWAANVTKVNVSALSQDMNITGNDLSNSITGGKGADTINGDDGNDTLVGGKDSDVFIYNSGNDIITDYKPNEDRIQMNPSAITSSTLKGSDVILTTDQGTLTIKGVKDKVVTFVDENGTTSEKIFYADMSYSPLETGLTYDAKRTVLTASSKYTNNEIDLSEHLETVAKVNVSALSQDMNIIGNDLNNSIKGGKGNDTINGDSGKDTISGGNDNDKLYGDNDNDVLKGDAGNDTLYGGSGNDTLTGGAGKDVFVYESDNDVITDYKTGEDKIKISAIVSSSVKGSDVILTTGNGTLTVKGAKDKVVTFVDNNGDTTEKIFYADTSYAPLETGLTYDAKRTVLTASNKYTGNTIDLGEYLETVAKINALALSQDINITGNDLNNSIKGGKGADTINGGSGKDTISGGNGADKLYGGIDNDVLKGDAGNDSLYGGIGNDTLTGGAGKDIFVYEGGNDVITDYKTNEDKIRMNSNAITSSTLKGSDVILTTDQGTLTIKGIKDKVVTFVDENGTTSEKIFYANMSYSPLETGLTYDAKKTALTASNKYTNSTIDLGEYLKTIVKVNASASSQDMNITGNNLANSIKSGAGSDIIFGGDLNDTIYGGSGEDKIYGDAGNDKLYGDAGNDTLVGGFGNDTLTGGNGSDVFVYEGGNDVITDYAAGDSIKISSGKISKTSYNGKNLIFTIGDSTLTVKNAKGKNISVTDSNGDTTTQIYSGTQTYARTLNLLYDCNFMTDELKIDDISEVTADDYSIGQIQSVSDSNIFDKATLVSDSSFDKK